MKNILLILLLFCSINTIAQNFFWSHNYEETCTRPSGLNSYTFYHASSNGGNFTSTLVAAKQACFDKNVGEATLSGQSDASSNLNVGTTVYENASNTDCTTKTTGYYLTATSGKIDKVVYIVNGVISALYDGISIGDSFGGGLVAYILVSGDPGYSSIIIDGIIVSSADLGTGTEWGCFGTDLSGAEGYLIGAGTQNTIDILNGCATSGIAARLCGDYSSGVYNDWCLPSKNDMEKLADMKVLGFGSFTQDAYWTSTEYPTLETEWAWIYDMRDVFMGFAANDKNVNHQQVRAIRYF